MMMMMMMIIIIIISEIDSMYCVSIEF